jgi:hypothetical protein
MPHSLHRSFCRTGCLLLVLAFGAFSLAGCGGAKKPLVVSGKVTKKGQPLGGGTMQFHPAGGGPIVPGSINPNGTFSFGGVPPGEYTITIETESVRDIVKRGGNYMKMHPDKIPEGMKVPDKPDPTYVPINRKYSDPKQSGLTWNVSSSNQSKDFDLTD